MTLPPAERLDRTLSLFDVYAISTGAMFSSGFFLLPGIAAGQAGPSVVLAYLFAGILVLPAMFSKAELSTAMPRAGGTYYFLDRSLGPAVGTVGGAGTWLALVLKSAFALVGMGAYLALFLSVPIKPLAVALIGVFTVINIVGAKETTGFQKILVVMLLTILALFVVQGLLEVRLLGVGEVHRTQFTPFLPFGAEGLVATVGLVFVSYAGLTKVASVAEEVRDPDRTIPLGMLLSLLTATAIYVLGAYVMVAVLDPHELREDLTPVATAGEAFLDWLPPPAGLILVVVAAVAAFASTGNAGLLSASRYPLAMARDRLIPEGFSRIGRFGTPVPAILLTSGTMVVCVLLLDVGAIAKLASAFQLLVFAFVNLSVIVMRESHIRGYRPGFRSPLYPWMQIVGIGIPFWLITEMGWLPVIFSLGMVAAGLVWYGAYARGRTVRDGAIYHVFQRLGRRRYDGLDRELLRIVRERGHTSDGLFEELVARAAVLDLKARLGFGDLARAASEILGARAGLDPDRLARKFVEITRRGGGAFFRGVGIPHATIPGVAGPELLLVRVVRGVDITGWVDAEFSPSTNSGGPWALCFLVTPADEPELHIRILSELVTRMGEEDFLDTWLRAEDGTELRRLLVHDASSCVITLDPKSQGADVIGLTLGGLGLPRGSLVATIRRGHRVIVPTGATVLETRDRLTVIGEPDAIEEVRSRLGCDRT